MSPRDPYIQGQRVMLVLCAIGLWMDFPLLGTDLQRLYPERWHRRLLIDAGRLLK